MSSLPLEIWLKILHNLHKNDIKEVSLVSRYLHEASIAILFNSVELWFGCFPGSYEENEQNGWEPEMEERFNLRSLDILLRIAQDTAFAQTITHLRVIDLADHTMVFERYHLRKALSTMYKLRRFEWIGEALCQDIAQELSANHPEMDSLYITQLDENTGTALSSIHGLSELRLIDRNKSSIGIVPNASPGMSVLNDIFDRNKGSLRRVALSGEDAWKCDLLRLSANLTHLAIDDAGQCDGLDLFLRHANNLESLTLLDLHTLRFLSGGPDDKDLLPKLISLKLQFDYPLYRPNLIDNMDLIADSKSLLSFMEHHKNLKRFDFSLWPADPTTQTMFMDDGNMQDRPAAPWFSNIIRAVQKLKDVRALGISFPSLPEVVMARLTAELCKVRLLRHCTSVRLSGLDEVDFHPIIDGILSRLENLSFLALHNARPFERCERNFRLPAAEDFVYTYPLLSLQTTCLANNIFDIDRSSHRYEPFRRWTAERIRMRTEADFPTADAHWLMSYRSISDQYDYAPNHPDDEEDFHAQNAPLMDFAW